MPPPTAPRRHFSLLVTVACAIVAAIYIGLPLGPLITRGISPLDQLERPEESLDRLVTRELDLREAMRHGQSWEWRLYRVLSGAEDPMREASGWYDELVDTVDSPRGRSPSSGPARRIRRRGACRGGRRALEIC